jgi:hypothetical protein
VVGGAVIGWFVGTSVLKILTKYVLMNPGVASKLPRIALWFLGMGGSSGRVANQVYQRYGSHMFEAKHGLDELISKYGKRGVLTRPLE